MLTDLAGNLKVAVAPAISEGIITKMIPIFSKQYSRTRVFVIENNPAHVVENVINKVCDVGFFVADEQMFASCAHEGCIIQRLFTEKVYAVM